MDLQAYEKEHIDRLRGALPECTVLLRTNGAFPLAAPGKLALYGSGARRTVKGGLGSGEVNSRYFDSVETGLEKAGFCITSRSWLNAYDLIADEAFEQFKRELKARARAKHTSVMNLAMGAVMPEPEYELPLDGEGDTAVYVLARISGEGVDRRAIKGDILLTDTEIRDIKHLRGKYSRFMLVLNVGGVVDLSPLGEIENILLLSQLGVETGDALADILLGRANPSGKLASTWAAWDEYRELEFGGCDDTRYREGVYVGYRWFDSAGREPLFPFGHGLSFTEFELSDITASAEGTRLRVRATVKNTGAYAGKEVVQVYVSAPAHRFDQPYQQLAAWAKTALLPPGESQTVTAEFDMALMAAYDAAGAAYILEKGDHIIRVGTGSRNTRAAAAVRLDRDVTVRRVRNALGKTDFADAAPCTLRDERAALPVIELDCDAFVTEEIQYEREYEIAPEAARLSDRELALLSNGLFSSGGIAGMIGNAAQSVCGAAGETAGVRGFRPLVMADGPAGVRIHQHYFVDKKGAHRMELPFPQSMEPFMPALEGFFIRNFTVGKPRRRDQIRSQYCTALPVGTALAQSWNPEIAELCGDIVGAEMELYNIDLWLAPALNIQRSIQCGRNFEYFSEDPVISGRFAAAVTRGVERHQGRRVTIKHFAANNQEFNRTSSNSMVSERALREIYLKGFEICLREAGPGAVMTSYNLINGRHSSTRRDLIEDILRCEFGFEGIVMTDWVIEGGMVPKDAKYPGPQAWAVAAAGGELFMPGSRRDWENVLSAIKSGRLDRKQLRINATRLLRFTERL